MAIRGHDDARDVALLQRGHREVLRRGTAARERHHRGAGGGEARSRGLDEDRLRRVQADDVIRPIRLGRSVIGFAAGGSSLGRERPVGIVREEDGGARHRVAGGIRHGALQLAPDVGHGEQGDVLRRGLARGHRHRDRGGLRAGARVGAVAYCRRERVGAGGQAEGVGAVHVGAGAVVAQRGAQHEYVEAGAPRARVVGRGHHLAGGIEDVAAHEAVAAQSGIGGQQGDPADHRPAVGPTHRVPRHVNAAAVGGVVRADGDGGERAIGVHRDILGDQPAAITVNGAGGEAVRSRPGREVGRRLLGCTPVGPLVTEHRRAVRVVEDQHLVPRSVDLGIGHVKPGVVARHHGDGLAVRDLHVVEAVLRRAHQEGDVVDSVRGVVVDRDERRAHRAAGGRGAQVPVGTAEGGVAGNLAGIEAMVADVPVPAVGHVAEVVPRKADRDSVEVGAAGLRGRLFGQRIVCLLCPGRRAREQQRQRRGAGPCETLVHL